MILIASHRTFFFEFSRKTIRERGILTLERIFRSHRSNAACCKYHNITVQTFTQTFSSCVSTLFTWFERKVFSSDEMCVPLNEIWYASFVFLLINLFLLLLYRFTQLFIDLDSLPVEHCPPKIHQIMWEKLTQRIISISLGEKAATTRRVNIHKFMLFLLISKNFDFSATKTRLNFFFR